MLTFTIDWFAVTFKEMSQDVNKWLYRYACSTPIVPETAFHGYSASTRDNNGVVQSWHDNRQEMGLHVVFSGSSLTKLAQGLDWNVIEFISQAVHIGGRVSRLDMAKDAVNEQVDLDNLWKQIQTGERTGSTRTFSRIESTGKGYTIYCGSRQSERFIRIYDKGAQTGQENADWQRFELELKGDVARAISAQISQLNYAGLFDELCLAMVDLPSNQHWPKFFPQGHIPVGLPKIEKQTDREKWILEQVMPSVAKHFIEHPESEAVRQLLAMLRYLDDTSTKT